MTRSIAATSFISRGWKVYCSFCSKTDILILNQTQLLASKGDANWLLSMLRQELPDMLPNYSVEAIWKKLLVGVSSSHWSSLTCQESISALCFFGIFCRFPKMMASITMLGIYVPFLHGVQQGEILNHYFLHLSSQLEQHPWTCGMEKFTFWKRSHWPLASWAIFRVIFSRHWNMGIKISWQLIWSSVWCADFYLKLMGHLQPLTQCNIPLVLSLQLQPCFSTLLFFWILLRQIIINADNSVYIGLFKIRLRRSKKKSPKCSIL